MICNLLVGALCFSVKIEQTCLRALLSDNKTEIEIRLLSAFLAYEINVKSTLF